MSDIVVRLQEVNINNFKNVEKGKISLQSYSDLKNDIDKKRTDFLGIYGQNGSGKTALVDAIGILKNILSGDSLPKDISYFINNASDKAELNFVFFIENKTDKYLVYYDFEIRKGIKEKETEISKEILSYSPIVEGTRRTKIKIVDYAIEYDNIIRPLERYNELVNNNKSNAINIGVSKGLSIENKKSFIFNDKSVEIFKNGFKNNNDYSNVIESLRHFAKINLFVIKNDQLGVINMNQLLPITFRLENDEKIISGDYIALFETSSITEEGYSLLFKIISQINTVIGAIIPGLSIYVIDYGKQLDDEGNMKIKIELVSKRDNKEIPLRYESDGIKKILSILSAMIAMYNNRAICLVIDELDAGIFEYLLGEILNVLEENAKGQFIFTSHNLRALEKLNKESIIFTTTNPKNRYIKLTNVKNNNNLRDFYLRSISLGGQKEDVYDETNTFEINYAFRKAGRVLNEK